MYCGVEFPEMVFGDGCLFVMWCGMIVYFFGVMYDFIFWIWFGHVVVVL